MSNNITYKVTEHIGVLSETDIGYTKEVNMVSWNGADPKVDIRTWYPDHERCSKGLTFTIEEAKRLRAFLNSMDW